MVSLATLLSPRRLHWLFLMGLVAAVWAAYWPSLEHVPRADQWAYLIDTLHSRSLGELWSESYSYNRVRAVGPGDADLFRPVLFALLVLEKWCFGNNFVPSQAISLILHTAVVLLLFTLLKRIARSGPIRQAAGFDLRSESAALPLRLLPYALTVFFALNFAGMELVVWAHLHGYLLFLVLVLGSLVCFGAYLDRKDGTARRAGWAVATCWLLALLSAFTYELGQFFGVILGAAIAGCVCRSRAGTGAALAGGSRLNEMKARCRGLALAGCFVAILPIYQAVNHWDRTVQQGRFAEEYLPAQIQDLALSVDTLEHGGRFLAFTAVQPFFPSVTGAWYQGERIHIQEPVFGWIKYVQPNAKLLLSYGILLLFLGLCIAGARRFWGGAGRGLWPMLLIPAALYALYAAITVLGRMNLRPSQYVLCSNSYYTYIALLFLLVAAFTLWQPLAKRSSRFANLSAAAMGVGLVWLGGYSAGRILHVSEKLAQRYAPFHATVRQLEAFIDEHRHEADFRIAFDMRPDDPFPVTHSIPFPLILYPQWIDNHEPKYVVSFPEGCFTVTAADDWRRQHPAPGRQLFPDLVRVGTDFNYYHWQGKYYGTLHWDDVFRPDVKDHAYVIVGETLREVLDEVPVRHEEFMEDLRTGWCIPPRQAAETIDEDYQGFTLTKVAAYYYAVPRAEAPFEVNRFNARRYSTTFVSEELTTLCRYVQEHEAQRRAVLRLGRLHRQQTSWRRNW